MRFGPMAIGGGQGWAAGTASSVRAVEKEKAGLELDTALGGRSRMFSSSSLGSTSPGLDLCGLPTVNCCCHMQPFLHTADNKRENDPVEDKYYLGDLKKLNGREHDPCAQEAFLGDLERLRQETEPPVESTYGC